MRLSPQQELAALADNVRPFSLVEIEFPDGMARACSLPFDCEIDGKVFSGIPVLGSIGEITEGPENRSYGVALTLAGIPLSFVDYILAQDVKGREVTLWIGFLNDENEIIGDVYKVFVGLADTLDLKVGQESAVQIAAESILILWERPKTRRYTPADQRARFPGDAGLDYVGSMVSKELPWGRTGDATTSDGTSAAMRDRVFAIFGQFGN